MPNQQVPIETIFGALGDPTRLAIITSLSRGPATVSALAAPCAMALPSFMQHLRLLESVGLVGTSKAGRVRTCRLNADVLNAAGQWVTSMRSQWEHRLDQLETMLAQPPLSSEEQP